MPRLNPQNPLLRLVGRHGQKLMRAPQVEGVTIRDIRDAEIRVRVYRPSQTGERPALLWVHGGGLVIGAVKQDDHLCAQMAAQLGITVVSAEYRLAPEHPFPAALDDVHEAWHWMLGKAPAWDIDTGRLAIGGESAGGGIAAGLVQRLHDEGGIQPIAQWLFAPMLDDRTALREELDEVNHPVWSNGANRFGWSSYLGQAPGGAEVPEYAVPARREDLTGLPPAWLCAGDIELFYDEIVDYASGLQAHGVDTELKIIPGGAHGFENWARSTELAQALLDDAGQWLRRQFIL